MPTDIPGADHPIPFAHPEAFSDPDRLLAAYFSSSTVGFCILDSELRYLAINETLAKMNGVPTSDHLGKTAREMLGDIADLIEPEFRRALTTGQPVTFNAPGKLPFKAEAGHWVIHFIPIGNEIGAVTRIAAVVLDITEQKKMEDSLRHLTGSLKNQMERLQMLVEVSSILASNWNVPQIFPAISARIRRILRQEYAGFSLHDASSGLLVRQAEDFPLSKGLLTEVQISAQTSPGGRSFAERTPMIFSREQLETFDAEIAEKFLAEGVRSLCCVPLLRPKGPLGVLVLGSTRPDAFQQDDLPLLNQVAQLLAIAVENQRAAAEINALQQRLSEEKKYLEGEPRSYGPLTEIVGESPALKQVLDQVVTVAPSDATVLILGETGTGKELVARAIHRLSRRHDQDFVKVNCAAIPTGLLESELFGHEKGAFTGAIARKVGRMELADGGTLFLDEVGEIPLELQPKLLRVLQDQEFERLGSTHTIKVNLRLIAATNRDLARSVADRQFRSDLFYRLNVFPIRVPPLRERREDIPLLVRYFVRKFASRMDRHVETIPKETMQALAEWSWPGNIRELENLMERSVILSEGTTLRVPLWELHAGKSLLIREADHSLDTAEREHIIRVLRETKGVLSGAERCGSSFGSETHYPAIEDAALEDYPEGLFRFGGAVIRCAVTKYHGFTALTANRQFADFSAAVPQ
jgi:formate hydrogenlyase transcriptional activator